MTCQGTIVALHSDSQHEGVRLRRADVRDATPVAALVAAAYRGYVERIGREPMPMRMDHSAAIARDEVWILEEGSRISGVLHLAVEADHVMIVNVAVRPDRQGRGLGRRLLDHAESRTSDLGRVELRLYTNERFMENLSIYRSRGFVETHRTPAEGTDLVHMRKLVT